MRTLNYKRKLRRRFFLLMGSRSPLISSEFRGGGLKPPTPTPQYATAFKYYRGEMHTDETHINKLYPNYDEFSAKIAIKPTTNPTPPRTL